MPIDYLIGDATRPVGPGPKILVHVCNDIGGWGRGFVMAISKRWPEPEQRYRAWHRGEAAPPFALGQVQFVQVEEEVCIANLIGQHHISAVKGVPPVRYQAIRQGLRQVCAEATRRTASVHMPRIGCGLAGGSWEEVSKIVEAELVQNGITVFVYDFAPGGASS